MTQIQADRDSECVCVCVLEHVQATVRQGYTSSAELRHFWEVKTNWLVLTMLGLTLCQ